MDVSIDGVTIAKVVISPETYEPLLNPVEIAKEIALVAKDRGWTASDVRNAIQFIEAALLE